MTSRRPHWYLKETVAMLVYQTNSVGVESILTYTLLFVPIHLHGCWPRECNEFAYIKLSSSSLAGHVRRVLAGQPFCSFVVAQCNK